MHDMMIGSSNTYDEESMMQRPRNTIILYDSPSENPLLHVWQGGLSIDGTFVPVDWVFIDVTHQEATIVDIELEPGVKVDVTENVNGVGSTVKVAGVPVCVALNGLFYHSGGIHRVRLMPTTVILGRELPAPEANEEAL